MMKNWKDFLTKKNSLEKSFKSLNLWNQFKDSLKIEFDLEKT